MGGALMAALPARAMDRAWLAQEVGFIPSVRLDNSDVWEVVHDRLRDLVQRGEFLFGPELEEFEALAAETFGCEWAVGVSSGTAALILALRAAPLRPGSRVAVPANTFFATFEAVVLAGHVPVVVDNDRDYSLSLEALDRIDVDAVVPVHLYGLPADMSALSALAAERGWWLLEDCAQAHGADVAGRPVGSLGDAGAFSCYPTKNVGAWGDAGFVTGSDPEMEVRIRALRHHAQGEANVHTDIGSADRMDNIQALVVGEKLARLPGEVEARRRVAGWYREELADLGLDLPSDRGDRRHVFHQFVVRVPERDGIVARMAEFGVGTAVHYPTPVHLQPGAAGRCEVPFRPQRAERWAGEILSLPLYPSLTQSEVERVADSLRAALR
jgi:dTDP-3-amino-3,4,6-trideoxy-alpha-D-glucose transaminase